MRFTFSEVAQRWELKDGSRVIFILELPSNEEIEFWSQKALALGRNR